MTNRALWILKFARGLVNDRMVENSKKTERFYAIYFNAEIGRIRENVCSTINARIENNNFLLSWVIKKIV